MSTVRSALIQTYGSMSMEENVERQIALIEQAAKQGAQITCLQELATGPYFCQVQDPKYYSFAEPVPDGPTVKRMRSWRRSMRWSSSCRSTRWSRPASTTTPPP